MSRVRPRRSKNSSGSQLPGPESRASAGGGGHDNAGGTLDDVGGDGAGGATGAAVVVKVDAVRLLLASAVGSYRCLLVGDCLSLEQQPPKNKNLARTYSNSSTTIRSKFSRYLVLK